MDRPVRIWALPVTTDCYNQTEPSDRLPLSPLLALAMTGFTAIMAETLPAGLLPQIAEGMAVSPAMAGQLVTAYAAGSLLAAIPLTSATQGWRRKPTLLCAIVGLLVFNTATAMAGSYWLALAARLLAGVAAGLAWGIIAGYARRMVADPLKGRALAIAMVGTPIALSLGVALWGLIFGGAATLLQTASADAAGEGVDIANAMVTMVWNAAIATGGLLGGVLLDRSGAGAFAWAILPMITVAFFVAAAAHRSGFRLGPRAHHRLTTA